MLVTNMAMKAVSIPVAKPLGGLQTLQRSHSGTFAVNVSIPKARVGSSICLEANASESQKWNSLLNIRQDAPFSDIKSSFKSRDYSLRLRKSTRTRAEKYDESVPIGTKVKSEEVEKQEKTAEVENVIKELDGQADNLKEKFNGAVDNLREETLKFKAPTEKSFAESTERAIGVLRDTTEQWREQTEKAKAILAATAVETAEKGRANLTLIAETAPEPIKDIAETALDAHSAGVPKKGAKMHDFCLGIPYGGFLVVWGLSWFIITGSTAAVRFGVILGGLILFSSIRSLKVWKKGESSLPFIKAQGALTLIILARDVQRFMKTKALFPSLMMCLISAAMVTFYGYVYFSGGNPPKKNKAVPYVQGA